MRELNSSTFPLDGRLLIEASAGTGKTYTISSLYLRLLLGRDPALTRPLLANEILVLTFTIAATDELRSRIRERVILARDIFSGTRPKEDDPFIAELVHSSSDINRDRKLLIAALQTMDEAAIFTIHGFCARILTEQSFATGMLFDQNLDGDRDVLLQVAAEDCFRKLIMPLPTITRNLALNLFREPMEMVRTLKPFLFRHGLRYLPAPSEINDELEQLIEDNQRCKNLWLDENITDLIAGANFKGNSKAVNRIKPDSSMFIENYCSSQELDPQVWEPWTTEELNKASRKSGTVMPEHPIFELMDSIYERHHLIQDFRTNLYHEVAGYITTHLEQAKSDLNQLTLDDLLTQVHQTITNPILCDALRSTWPVAMIDEFQDTDDLQFEIFSTIYGAQDHPYQNSVLLFIGDPKQAIYNFRGADVYTYLNAKQTTNEQFSLGTNWRSTPVMVNAINHLFNKPNIFGENTPIGFEPVKAAEQNEGKELTLGGTPLSPVSIFLDEEKNAKQNRTNLMNHAAEEVVKLLHQAQAGSALINNEPVTPGQIAFLVRDRHDAKAARQALAARGIRSVYVTQESVFLTETAEDLKLILEAVVDPTNERAIKAAMGTRLLQCTTSELYELTEDWSSLHGVMTEFQHYHHLWATLEVAPMIERLMIQRRIPEKWLTQPDGERQITNLRHLAEILQHRSLTAPGMRRLLKWFQREKQSAETVAMEERQLRLESDSNLVQIVTMHVSKGLEYDIVMMPVAGFGEPRGQNPTPLFHIQEPTQSGSIDFTPAIDFSGAKTSQTTARQEDFDESMRLMYVALTRARYRVYLGLGLGKQIHQTPIAKLIGFSSSDLEDIEAAIRLLPANLFSFTPLSDGDLTTYKPEKPKLELAAPRTTPEFNWHWRMHSYTGLTRLLSAGEAQETTQHFEPRPAYGDDEVQAKARPELEAVPSKFTFPRGAKVGIALHSFMEHLSFSAPTQTVQEHAAKCLSKMGVEDADGVWCSVLTDWFKEIVATPLNDSFCLQDIADSNRLDEMEFHFPIQASHELLRELKNNRVLPDHMEMKIDELEGMMTGYIDLIVRHENKFYLIDYKSNDLGLNQEHYSNSALTDAVKHHHYDLQYLIYGVALNRYLSQRVAGYDYDTHFGGVHYLFLRGMDGSPESGVYSDQPPKQLVAELDRLLGGSL